MVPEPLETIIEVTVPADFAGIRLDQALARLLPDWSRSRLQTWIREKRISVDGAAAIPKQKVWSGEKIEVRPASHPAEAMHAPEPISLDIVYEDDSLIVINKPAGLVVHPGSGNWQGTMLNALLHHAAELNSIPRAGIVHRLDKETSGLLVVAKTLEAQTHLVRQLQKHTVNRDYLALVLGSVSAGGSVDAPVGRHPVERTKMAVTARWKTGAHFLSSAGKAPRMHAARMQSGNRTYAPDSRAHALDWTPAFGRPGIWGQTGEEHPGRHTDDRFLQAGPSCVPARINPSATWGENGVARSVTRRYEKPPADARASE